MLKFKLITHHGKSFLPVYNQKRTFWNFVNMMFNKPDPDRIKKLGPDRACAEWVLKNGGRVVWADGKSISDYNSLPSEEQKVPKISEIDASGSGISHYGFAHLAGCTMLRKIILHNNSYIDDQALKGLAYGSDRLAHVQVSQCYNVTDPGVKEIKALSKLETLVLFDLSGVNNLDDCKQYLQTHLPQCKIEGASTQMNEKQ